VRRGTIFPRAVGAVARRPLVAIAVVLVLALGGGAAALTLEPSAGTDTLVSGSSDSARATERFKQDFGDDAIIVLVQGDLQRTLYSADLGRLIRLEGCLSGNVPEEGLRELPPGCTQLAELDPARVVFGPGTFINTSVNQIGEQFQARSQAQGQQAEEAAASARALSRRRGDPPARQRELAESARELVQTDFQRQILELGLRYGITSVPSLDNPEFIDTLVFERSQGGPVGVPKSRFAYLFPSRDSAVIQVRLRPGISEAERTRTIELIREVTSDPSLTPQEGARYVVTGVPVVVDGLAREVRGAILWLLGASVLVMAATLLLVFRTRLPLLPLALALAAAAMTYGVLALAGGSLTMASIAVLPVLIGLAVDYAIQFHARFDEVRSRRRGGGAQGDEGGPEIAAEAAAAGGPTIATAGAATAMGFLVLLLSPVPMVRGFGLLVVAGIAIALVCALTAGFATLARFAGRPPGERPAGPRRLRRRDRPDDLPPAFPRVRAWIGGLGLRPWARERAERGLAYSIARPRRVLAIGLAVAIVGWAVDTQSDVTSDVRELVPSDLPALQAVNELEQETGVAGEVDVTVRADDVTDPEVIAWMSDFQERTLREAGYEDGDRCAQERDPPDLCPALSLPTLLATVDSSDQDQVRGLLDAVPDYFSQGVITEDNTTANLAFGIGLNSLEEQNRVINEIKERLDPPEGVSASVVGLPVLAGEANAALSSPWRRALTLVLALLAVFAVLLAVRRSRREAAVPLIPIALATGWSAGILFMLGLLPGALEVDLNPMSVTLGALVIAISTEFSVLLSARYRQEREAGAGPARAIELTYASTGTAVMASGLTAIAGFAALIASDIRMLRDFGILTVVDLSVSLLGVMLVLPAALVWAEQHGPFGVRDLDPRPFLRELAGAASGLRPGPIGRPSLRPLLGRLRRR
jgi:hydrophobe/amphiphile efflux-3 (HAE3) family protein